MSASPVRVLYIDDDPGLTRLVQRALGRVGYVVETAGAGEEGLARLARGGIDVVALDHFLPTGTGLDYLPDMRAMPDAPPVVYVTASGETAVAVAALKAGAVDYVPKAVGDEFLALLRSAIDQSMERARLERERDRAMRETRIARDKAEMLLHEVNHRVANSLALVAAMVRLQANATEDPEAKILLAETQARISAIVQVHRRLYTSDDVQSVSAAEYLSGLLTELEAAMKQAGHDATVRLAADDLRISTDKAVSIGVIVTELVTNAFKYAYPAGSGGEIRVSLRAGAAPHAELVVEDDGVGYTPSAQSGTRVGTRIVNAMAESLGATIETTCHRGYRTGLVFEIGAASQAAP